jgi:osmoprotectant transport system substrate-binding protein
MGFSTDPQITDLDITVLEDDENFFPTYNPVPVADAESVPMDSAIGTQLDKLGPAIGGVSTVRELNGRVIQDDERPKTVATDFLTDAGIV